MHVAGDVGKRHNKQQESRKRETSKDDSCIEQSMCKAPRPAHGLLAVTAGKLKPRLGFMLIGKPRCKGKEAESNKQKRQQTQKSFIVLTTGTLLKFAPASAPVALALLAPAAPTARAPGAACRAAAQAAAPTHPGSVWLRHPAEAKTLPACSGRGLLG